MRAALSLLFALAASPTLAQAIDPAKTPPITAKSLRLGGAITCAAGTTCDASPLSVTAGSTTLPLSSWLPTLAPKASPTFSGSVTAPSLTLSGSGSTGDVSGMSVTANGTTQTLGSFLQAFPGASSNVAGVGVPGLYNPPGFFIYQQPASFAVPPAMRVQRDVPTGGAGSAGNTYKAIWGITNTNANSPGYEWAVTGEVFNKTVGTTGAQNVGVNGTIHKIGTPGGPAIGPSWGGNFNCLDETGQVNPTYSCIGTEINSNTTASGTDANRQRVGLHVAVSSLSPSTGANFGYGIKVDAYPNDTLDRGIALRARQRIGLDLTGANITGAGISLASGQKIAFDGADVDGSFNRTLRGQDGLLVYATPQGDVFKVTDAGQVIAPSITSPTATNGVLTGAFIRTSDPTAADIPSGQCADWINTTTGAFYHACVYQGTLRKVAMN